MATNEQANREDPGPASHPRSPLVLVLLVLMLINVGATGKGALREEILNELNQILTSGKARHIYFKEFVVQ
jgi:Flagellar basal body-associated protein FliL